jgi:hypothetical protein
MAGWVDPNSPQGVLQQKKQQYDKVFDEWLSDRHNAMPRQALPCLAAYSVMPSASRCAR